MRKVRIRYAGLIPWMICLVVIACCVPMAAPGFSLYGTKAVDLKYDSDLVIKGGYPSIWRLRFNHIGVTTRDPRKMMEPITSPEGVRTSKEVPLALDYPLAIILQGSRYNVGELTPDTILALGGSVYDLPYGDKSCCLQVGPHSDPQAAQISISFYDGRPFSFSCYASSSMQGPMVASLSYSGGSPLRLPASEEDIVKAFGPPQHRDARVVIPDKSNQPLLTVSRL
jgi:hypothetical protein